MTALITSDLPTVLDVRDAVLGDDLVLHHTHAKGVILHAIDGGRARRLGEFIDAADAWRAIDAIDEAEPVDHRSSTALLWEQSLAA